LSSSAGAGAVVFTSFPFSSLTNRVFVFGASASAARTTTPTRSALRLPEARRTRARSDEARVGAIATARRALRVAAWVAAWDVATGARARAPSAAVELILRLSRSDG
jgi:hypothetical protein